MSYCVNQTNGKFYMEKKDTAKALESLKTLASEKNFKWLKTDSFENALRSFGFVLSGNKEAYTEIAYEDDFYSHSEIICLNAIAPYVKNGSFVEFAGEDGDCWRIVFNNGQAKHINPQIVWDMPAEEIEEERC